MKEQNFVQKNVQPEQRNFLKENGKVIKLRVLLLILRLEDVFVKMLILMKKHVRDILKLVTLDMIILKIVKQLKNIVKIMVEVFVIQEKVLNIKIHVNFVNMEELGRDGMIGAVESQKIVRQLIHIIKNLNLNLNQ